MPDIKNILNKYHAKVDALDLELLVAASIGKPREFILAHPEHKLTRLNLENLKLKISRRKHGEPLAYILGKKEFFGLNFAVNKSVLIPRPETELLVEKILKLDPESATIIDVGTGSGNIIISLAKNLKNKNSFIAIDISENALMVAKKNARAHDVAGKIKFKQSELLDKIIENRKIKIGDSKIFILANLPYLSKDIYSRVSREIKKYEPKSALLSGKNGLAHYEKLLRQLGKFKKLYSLPVVSCFLEIGPEQKSALRQLSTIFFPEAKITFFKDLAARWRICQIDL